MLMLWLFSFGASGSGFGVLKPGSQCSCNCRELTFGFVVLCAVSPLQVPHAGEPGKGPPVLSCGLEGLIQHCCLPWGFVMYSLHHMLRFLLLPNWAPWQLAGLLLLTSSFA